MNAKQIRELYPITKERAYLFSGGLAPVSGRHEKAIKKHMDMLKNDILEDVQSYQDIFNLSGYFYTDENPYVMESTF